MIVYTLIGEPKAGKTVHALKIIEKYPFVLVFDPVNTDFKNLPIWDFKTKKGKFRLCPEFMQNGKLKNFEFEQFLDLPKMLANCLFVFEEASSFLDGKIPKQLVSVLNQRRHRANRYLFIFHNWGQIPPKIVSMSDYIIQFRTQLAETNVVKQKYGNSMVQVYEDKIFLNDAPKYSKRIFRNSSMAKDGII